MKNAEVNYRRKSIVCLQYIRGQILYIYHLCLSDTFKLKVNVSK